MKTKNVLKKPSDIIFVLGVILLALRILFPVLQCNNNIPAYCPRGSVIFFTFNQPVDGYGIHEWRTFTQAAVIIIIFVASYILAKQNQKNISD